MSCRGCKEVQTCIDGLIFCAGLEKSRIVQTDQQFMQNGELEGLMYWLTLSAGLEKSRIVQTDQQFMQIGELEGFMYWLTLCAGLER